MRSLRLIALAASLAFVATAARAQGDIAAGVGVGTDGLEAQVAYSFGDRASVRASGNLFNVDRDEEYDGVDYDAGVKLNTVAGFVDVRPFANAFTLTGGAYFGTREASIVGTPMGTVEIGDQPFTQAQVGSLVGKIDLGDFAPYAGVGFDNTFTSYSPLGFRVSAGVAFGDDPDVSLNSVGGTLSNDQGLQTELRKEEANISDDAELLKYYPVISAGIFWRF